MAILRRRSYRSATVWFVVALVVLQALAGSVLLGRQRAMLLAQAERAAHNELTLIESLVREPLLRHDYSTVVAFLHRWGERDPEIERLRALGANGFVLTDFARRGVQGGMAIELERRVTHRGTTLATLAISRGLDSARQRLEALRRQLLIGGALFTALLGGILWRILNRLGIRPLEREIERRSRVEAALREHRNRLDQEVRARTGELREANRRLAHQANYDPLTELGNRRLLDGRLQAALARGRGTRQRFALLYLDLDRFKDLNDSLGHSAGDELLLHTAARLRECVGAQGLVGRFGGDEFVLLQEPIADNGAAAHLAEVVLERVRQPLRIRDRDIFPSASVGIAVFPDDGDSGEALLRSADAAMYLAKREGINTFRFSTPALKREASERLWTENRLRRALYEERLELHYQPQFELATGRPVAYEALLRWRDEEMGLVLPDRFIPLAEESGLVEDIGRWALRTACNDARLLHDSGCFAPRVAVNVSGRQFRDRAFGRTVADTLSSTGLAPSCLEMELTESQLVADKTDVGRRLHELKEVGLRVAIDDFGTGYSSLAYLKRFPIDCLKIDKSFIRDVTHSRDDAAIVDAVLAMSHSLGYEVVAEGVETARQARFLQERNCQLGQGYFYGRAEPAAEVRARVKEWCLLAVPVGPGADHGVQARPRQP